MRQITRDAVNAFMNNEPFSRGNTRVVVSNFIGATFLYLHNNMIASKCHTTTGSILISNAGWPTATTKERLNGIPNVTIRQKKGVWYLNGKQWGGSWIETNQK